jgi:hypothetical protein
MAQPELTIQKLEARRIAEIGIEALSNAFNMYSTTASETFAAQLAQMVK